jgi:hypothetical protein
VATDAAQPVGALRGSTWCKTTIHFGAITSNFIFLALIMGVVLGMYFSGFPVMYRPCRCCIEPFHQY